MSRRPVILSLVALTTLAVVVTLWLYASAEECAPPCATAPRAMATLLPATATLSPTPPPVSPTRPPSATPPPVVVPFGSTADDEGELATPSLRARLVREEALRETIGGTRFATVEEMPEEARYYFESTVAAVSDFFEVRPDDLVALLLARQGGTLRFFVAEEEAYPGVAALSHAEWNGWAAPEQATYLTDLRAIEQWGGLGFDWRSHDRWRAWREERRSSGSAISTAADPARFDNSVAALARVLLRAGLTSEHAARDPLAHERHLSDGLLEMGVGGRGGVENREIVTPALAPLHDALRVEMDRTWGVWLSEEMLGSLLAGSPTAAAVSAGEIGVAEGAARVVEEVTQRFLEEGRAAQREGRPLPWPFATDELSLRAQQVAVQRTGHSFAPWELALLLEEAEGDLSRFEREVGQRGDAVIFVLVGERLDEALQRRAQGVAGRLSEVAQITGSVMAPYNQRWRGSWSLELLRAEIEQRLRRLPEYRAKYGDLFFAAAPFDPMPTRIVQRFGVRADYDASGYHTGIDLRGDRVNGQQPDILAVEDGVVVYVGPLYCDVADLCRGPFAVILDHGNNVYSTYSHNSLAWVEAGQRVSAGQPIARQGNLGYSLGPHLHLEVHLGVPYSGDWSEPWNGGEFVDPWPWLPQ